MSMRMRLLCAAVALASAAPVAAAPFSVTFMSGVTNPAGVPGVSLGDPFLVDVMVDNGGASALSQVWTFEDILAASVSAGAYAAEFVDGFFVAGGGFPTAPAFRTDALGMLTIADFFGTVSSLTAVDNAGGSGEVRLFNGGHLTSLGSLIDFTPAFGNPADWSNPVATPVDGVVPLPPAAFLLLAGLGALGVAARRRG